MTPAEFVALLEGVRGRQGSWEARCPAHDDREPSLSVGEGRDGKVLIYCHAGCTPEQIASAVGVEIKDLCGDAPTYPGASLSRREHVATYDYVDEHNDLLFQVLRYFPKDFRQRAPGATADGGWNWSTKHVRKVLYRLPNVIEAIAQDRTVFVAEGEKDVHALESIGVTATCNPGGQGKWKPEYTETLRGAHVVLLPDHDEPGLKHMDRVKGELEGVALSVQVLDLHPGGPEKADPADWVEAGGTMERLYQTLDGTASPTEPGSLTHSVSLRDLIEDPELLKPPRMVVPYFCAEGRVTLFASREKGGKSTVISAITAAVSSGHDFLGKPTDQGKVHLIALEDHPGDTARRLLDFEVDPGHIHISWMTSAAPQADILEAATRMEPSLIVIDTLYAFLRDAGIPESGDSATWTQALTPIVDVARQTNAAILITHHGRKEDGSYRDSTAIGANVDLIMEMRSKDDGSRAVRAKGRIAVDDFTFVWIAAAPGKPAKLALAGDELPLELQILNHVEQTPGIGVRDLRARLQTRSTAISDTVRIMLRKGTLEDFGKGQRIRLRIPSTAPQIVL